MVTTGSQKITVWGSGGTPLGILRVKITKHTFLNKTFRRNGVKLCQNTRAIQLESLQFKNKEPDVNIQREDA
jgi:hypothetical protein